MTASVQSRPVIFAGENPLILLHQPDSEEIVAAASLWRATFTGHGAGYALVIHVDPAASGLGDRAPSGIYTDNAPLAGLVWTDFSQHFGPFQGHGIDPAAAVPARFTESAGGRAFHRITAAAGSTVIDLLWQDIRDVVHNRESAAFGGASWEITNVVAPCARAAITVDGHPIPGQIRETGGAYGTTAFLAFCETWVRR